MKKLFKISALSALLATSAVANAVDTIGFVDPGYVMQNHPVLLDASIKFENFMKENQAKFADEDKKLAEENKKLTAERDALNIDSKNLQKEQATVEATLKKEVAQLEKDAPRLRAKEIQARQAKIEGKAKAFENKVSAIQKREQEFVKKAEDFQKRADAFQQKIEDANKNSGGLNPQEAQKTAIDEVNSTIKEVAKAKGYTLILQPQIALYAEDESKDITEAVLDAIKAKHPEIKLPEAPKVDATKTEQAKPEEVKK